MYSGQLDQFTTLSVSDVSVAALTRLLSWRRSNGRRVPACRAAGCKRGGGGDSCHPDHCRTPGNQTPGQRRLEGGRHLITHENSLCPLCAAVL